MKKYFYTLINGVKIPAIGFGTWQIPDGDVAYESVRAALNTGYRHIDTAMAYNNENSVGKAIKDSNLNRENVFVTTKLPAQIKGFQVTLDAFQQSLDNLGLDYIDLYLIHAPKPWGVEGDGMDYMEQNIASWKAFENLYKEGKIKAIGVSNFNPEHLKMLIKHTEITPMVNQILINPNIIPRELITYCRDNDILIEAYSPLATGRIFTNDFLEEIAKKYDRSVAQICLRWSYQNNFLPLPKSITDTRIIENLDIFNFEIDQDDMDVIGIV